MIKEIKDINIDTICELYKEEGWNKYLKDISKLKIAFDSSTVYAYFDEDKLIGFIRVLTDNAHILYIQDLIVSKKYRNLGIGKKLLSHVLYKYDHIRSKVLITDINDEISNGFYKSFEFEQLKNKGIIGYIK